MVHRGAGGLLDVSAVAPTEEVGGRQSDPGLAPRTAAGDSRGDRDRPARAVEVWWRRDVEPQLVGVRRKLQAASRWRRVGASFLAGDRGLVAGATLALSALHPAVPRVAGLGRSDDGSRPGLPSWPVARCRRLVSSGRPRRRTVCFFLHRVAELLTPRGSSA
jgi:hypothetical protein